MDKKVKLDPKKVEYDGRGFKVVIANVDEFKRKIERLRDEVLRDIEKGN